MPNHGQTKSQWKKGCISPNKGRKHSLESIDKMRMVALGRKHSEETKRKMSRVHKKLGTKPPSSLGKRRTEEMKEKLRKYWTGRKRLELAKENNPRWLGGVSFEPYSSLFDTQLKEKIRVRDNFKCCLCGIPELECNARCSIHHIDYDKKNSEESNLVSLCKKCHGKVHMNRLYWKEYFSKILKEDLCNV